MVKSKKSLIERTRARMESRKVEGEQGSLILDILIGMAIFALIAIIAVSAISQYRERAYAQAVVSDAKSVALAMEANYTDTQTYVTPIGATLPAGVNLSQGVEIKTFATTGGAFNICVVHVSGGAKNATTGVITGGTLDASVMYNSATGGIVGSAKRGTAANATCA